MMTRTNQGGTVGAVNRLGRLAQTHGIDVLAVVLAAISLVRVWSESITPRGITSLLALFATLPLLARRRFPLGAPLVALASLLGLSILSPGAAWEELQLFFGALLAFWVIGSENDRRRATLGLALGLAIAAATVTTDKGHRGISDYVFGLTTTAAAWLGGVVLGSHARSAAAA